MIDLNQKNNDCKHKNHSLKRDLNKVNNDCKQNNQSLKDANALQRLKVIQRCVELKGSP